MTVTIYYLDGVTAQVMKGLRRDEDSRQLQNGKLPYSILALEFVLTRISDDTNITFESFNY